MIVVFFEIPDDVLYYMPFCYFFLIHHAKQDILKCTLNVF